MVWNMNGLWLPLFWNWMMIQSDELIFFRGVGIPPSSNMLGVSKKWDPKVTIDGFQYYGHSWLGSKWDNPILGNLNLLYSMVMDTMGTLIWNNSRKTNSRCCMSIISTWAMLLTWWTPTSTILRTPFQRLSSLRTCGCSESRNPPASSPQ